MSKTLTVLSIFGLIILAIGLIEFIFGIFAASGVNLAFGGILSFVGSIILKMSATRIKKQKDQEENSQYSCMECNLQTNTKKEILTHANTTGHDFILGIRQHDETSPTNSIEILKTRYAKGEITKEQYDQMKRDLAG